MTMLWIVLKDGRTVGGTYETGALLERLSWLLNKPAAVEAWWLA